MCRIDLCGQIGVKISSYGDTQFIKLNPLIRPWGRIIPREDRWIDGHFAKNWIGNICLVCTVSIQ